MGSGGSSALWPPGKGLARPLGGGRAAARGLGYSVRQEWLDGEGGGVCILRGERILFVDLSQNINDQLDIVLDVLRQDPAMDLLDPTLLGRLDPSGQIPD